MAVCQAGRYRCLAVLVSSYRVCISFWGLGVPEGRIFQKLLGEPKLPQSLCSYFYCVCGLFVFVECPSTRLCLWNLPIGSQEQTDCFGRCVAMIIRSNQFRRYLGVVFIILGLVVGQAPNTTPLQKNQLAAPPPCCSCYA